MIVVRYIVGAFSFLLVMLGVGIVVSFAIGLVFPAPDGTVEVGIGTDPRFIPGTILGILAGIQSFRVSVRGKKKPSDRSEAQNDAEPAEGI